MKKVLTYELTFSVDKTVMGSSDNQIIGFIDPENNSGERSSKYQEIYYDFIEDNFDMKKFSGDKKAKPTDILSSNFLVMNGLFVSSAFAGLLAGFSMCCYKYRDVYIEYLSEKKDYQFLNLIMCPAINFEESSFFFEDKLKGEKLDEIKLSSLQDFRDNIKKLRADKGYNFTISPQKLVLSKMYDLFKYELSGKFLISEELKNGIEKSGLTGYSITPFLDVLI